MNLQIPLEQVGNIHTVLVGIGTYEELVKHRSMEETAVNMLHTVLANEFKKFPYVAEVMVWQYAQN